MRRSFRLRAAAITGVFVTALALCACGNSSSRVSAQTVAAGRQIFETSGCGGCHTLAALGTHSEVGPSLDQLRPDYASIFNQVRNGGGGMPAFTGQLSQSQIETVAHFVVAATQGGSRG